MIDRRLNYGREDIALFLRSANAGGASAVVVDIGAGWGEDLERARKLLPGAVCHAVEISDTKCRVLAQKGFVVHQLDIERDRLPLESESADIIIANQIVEHVKEIFWLFHEMSRVLKIGGTLIVGVPNLAALHNRVLLLLGRQPTVLKLGSAHVRGVTWSGFREFLGACFPDGYEIVARTGANFYPFPPALARVLARLFPELAWGFVAALRKRRKYDREFLDFVRREALETNFWLGAGQWGKEGFGGEGSPGA